VVRLLLSLLPALRRLYCDAGTARAVVLPERPTVRGHHRLFRVPSAAPLSIAQLTELAVNTVPVKDAELKLLLSACPQLLRLDCAVSHSSNVVLIAARCCPCLLELSVHGEIDPRQAGDAAIAEAEPVALNGHFLPQLVTLALFHNGYKRPPPCFSDCSFLQHLIARPHAQLRHLHLHCSGLTAQPVLSLSCLPRLSGLVASSWGLSRDCAAVLDRACSRSQQQVLRTSGHAEFPSRCPLVYREACEECTTGHSALINSRR
jgi:hypothetical protein